MCCVCLLYFVLLGTAVQQIKFTFLVAGFNFLLLHYCAVALAVATSGKMTSLHVTESGTLN